MGQTPEERIAAIAPQLTWGHHCLATDPIGMEYQFEGDPAIRRELAAIRLDAISTVFHKVADASSAAAKVMSAKAKR
jgi:hypothetical protein